MLYRSCIFILSLLAFISCCFSSKNINESIVWNDALSTEENIAVQATAFQSDKEFPFLDELARTRSVIFLGESGHDDATTLEIKKNMIFYLYKKGVKTVAFEGYPFLSCYLLSNKEYHSFTKKWLSNAESNSIWAKEMFTEMRFFLDRNISVVGIDVYAGFYDIDAVKIIFNKYQTEFPLQINWDKLREYYYRKFIYPVYVNQSSIISINVPAIFPRLILHTPRFLKS